MMFIINNSTAVLSLGNLKGGISSEESTHPTQTTLSLYHLLACVFIHVLTTKPKRNLICQIMLKVFTAVLDVEYFSSLFSRYFNCLTVCEIYLMFNALCLKVNYDFVMFIYYIVLCNAKCSNPKQSPKVTDLHFNKDRPVQGR